MCQIQCTHAILTESGYRQYREVVYLKTMKAELLELIIDAMANNEMILMAIADLDNQRDHDKTETELAIAELAEILVGGI